MGKNEIQQINTALSTEQIDFDAWERTMLDWVIAQKTERTSQAYRRCLGAFLDEIELHPAFVTASDVTRWNFWQRQQRTPETANMYLSAVSSFFAFAIGRGLRPDNPCKGATRAKINVYGKATALDYESGEDKAFLSVIDRSTDQGKRDYAIMLLYLTLAVRVSALANLRMKHLRMQNEAMYMIYTNKGGLSIETKLPGRVMQAIEAYLKTRGALQEDDPVFTATERGERAIDNLPERRRAYGRPLTVRMIQKLVRKYADHALGKQHGITPHSLRHTAAVNAAESGATGDEVMNLLQHSRRSTTDIYLQKLKKKLNNRTSELLASRYDD